ncbi:MAG: acyl-CoA dehydrogenase family protein [Pseudomonadales bacterium]
MAEQTENKKTKRDSPEQADFRQYVRAWLTDNNPPLPDFKPIKSGAELVTTEQRDYYCAWQKSAYDAGLVGCDYPAELGGGGRSKCQSVANQEMARAKTPIFPSAIGLGMGAPTIFFHGSEELKKLTLPQLFSGEELWCQGFSEPGSGSDLASVQTFARREGDKWIISGHKVWTSTAHFATWMILLARTDKTDKYNGLSYFVVPIKSQLGKTVTVSPLIKITGEAGFNEVIFDNLQIDDSFRLDEVGKGWQVAMTTLKYERGAGEMSTPTAGGQRAVTTNKVSRKSFPLVNLAKNCSRNGKPAIDDPLVRDQVMKMLTRSVGIKQNRRLRGVPALANPQRLALQDKLLSTEYLQNLAAVAMEIEGMSSTLTDDDDKAPDAGRWPFEYLSSFGGTIAGGTNEIQKNILGERILGLAKTK